MCHGMTIVHRCVFKEHKIRKIQKTKRIKNEKEQNEFLSVYLCFCCCFFFLLLFSFSLSRSFSRRILSLIINVLSLLFHGFLFPFFHFNQFSSSCARVFLILKINKVNTCKNVPLDGKRYLNRHY